MMYGVFSVVRLALQGTNALSFVYSTSPNAHGNSFEDVAWFKIDNDLPDIEPNIDCILDSGSNTLSSKFAVTLICSI